jgi:hypothetical protein
MSYNIIVALNSNASERCFRRKRSIVYNTQYVSFQNSEGVVLMHYLDVPKSEQHLLKGCWGVQSMEQYRRFKRIRFSTIYYKYRRSTNDMCEYVFVIQSEISKVVVARRENGRPNGRDIMNNGRFFFSTDLWVRKKIFKVPSASNFLQTKAAILCETFSTFLLFR